MAVHEQRELCREVLMTQKQKQTYFKAFNDLHDAGVTLKEVCIRELLNWITITNAKREAQIDEGNFVYHVVDGRTSNRKHNDIGEPIIYATKTDAEYACVEYDEIISIAAYNRMYGRFMGA